MEQQQITIEGVAYVVVRVRQFSHNGKGRQSLTLRRPAGRRLYSAVHYENGSISDAIPVPGAYLPQVSQ